MKLIHVFVELIHVQCGGVGGGGGGGEERD